MKIPKYLLTLALVLISCGAAHCDDTPDPLKAAAKDSLARVIKQFVQSPEAAKYFHGIDQAKMAPVFNLGFHQQGWIGSWGYNKDVSIVPNPDKSAQAAAVPVVDTADGIYFQIFIAYDRGDTMVSRQRTFVMSEKPPLSFGYELMTKTKDDALEQKLDEILDQATREMKMRLSDTSSSAGTH